MYCKRWKLHLQTVIQLQLIFFHVLRSFLSEESPTLQNELDIPSDVRNMLSDFLFSNIDQLEQIYDNNMDDPNTSPPDDSVLVKLIVELRTYFGTMRDEVDKMFRSLTHIRQKVRVREHKESFCFNSSNL